MAEVLKHAPLPWGTEGCGGIHMNGRRTGYTLVDANGKRLHNPFMTYDDAHAVVTAVNCHYDLLAALNAQEAFDNHCMDCGCCQDGSPCEVGAGLSMQAQNLRSAAIVKAIGSTSAQVESSRQAPYGGIWSGPYCDSLLDPEGPPDYDEATGSTPADHAEDRPQTCHGCVYLHASMDDGAGGGTWGCLRYPGDITGEWGHWVEDVRPVPIRDDCHTAATGSPAKEANPGG